MGLITLTVLSNFQFIKTLTLPYYKLSQKLFIIGKLYLLLNYKFFASKSRINTYVKCYVKNYKIRVSKQSVIRSKNGVKPTMYVNLRWFVCRKIWQKIWNAHRRLTYGEYFVDPRLKDPRDVILRDDKYH